MTTNFYHNHGTREYDRENMGEWDDREAEELTDEERDRIAAEIHAINLEEGRRQGREGEWEAGLPEYDEGEIEW